MKLKSIPESIMIYGAPIKGCKVPESAHMITFFNTLRREYPEHAKCCLHIRNEGKRTRQQIEKEKAEVLDIANYDTDNNFAFIVGYTSGGFPYGLTHGELENEDYDTTD